MKVQVITRYAQGKIKKAKKSIYDKLLFTDNKTTSTKVLMNYKNLSEDEIRILNVILNPCGYKIK